MWFNRSVLVLNQYYEPISVCSARRAVVLVVLGKAEIIERDSLNIRSVSIEYPLPSVVRLILFARNPRRVIQPTRKNVIRRDRCRCQYCGRERGPMTTDHVIPRKIGGKDSWDNLVCACISCNNRKGDRTPEEAGMKLLRQPRMPHYISFIGLTDKPVNQNWKPYLFQGSSS